MPGRREKKKTQPTGEWHLCLCLIWKHEFSNMERQLLPALVAPWSSCSWACQMLEVPYPTPCGFLPNVQHCFNHDLSSTSTFITHFKERAAAKIIISSAFPLLSEQSLFLSSSNTPGALQTCSSGGPWLISLLSLPKPLRAALKLLKAPQSLHSIAKTSLWAWKVRDGTLISVTLKTRPQGSENAVNWENILIHQAPLWQLVT